jgi:Spy/CpxP family protein refolding chaperone
MKNSKMLVVAVVLFSLISSVSRAQDFEKKMEERKKEMVENMKMAQEKLKLTDEQKEKFKEISKKYAEKVNALRDTKEERRAKLKEAKSIQDEKDAEMKLLLKKDQYETYLQLKEERKSKMKEMRKRG